jgi:hypothetical protein
MSRATSRTNIKILALPPNTESQEEAKKRRRKMLERMLRERKLRIHRIKKITIRIPQQ